MNLDKFYRTVEDFVLHPGSVDDLNDDLNEQERRTMMERGACTPKVYQIMPQTQGKGYLEGIIIPDKSLVEESLRTTLKAVSPSFNEESIRHIMDWFSGRCESMLSLDIRVRAKEVGAHGLVQIQYIGPRSFDLEDPILKSVELGQYLGVPVKLKEN